MVNSIRKGKSGEREIVHLLTKITGAEWKRVPSSGGLFTSQGSSEFKGDVYCHAGDYAGVVVEVKNHKGSVAITDFAKPKSKISSWLKQLRDEAGFQKGVLFFKSKGKWCWMLHNCKPVECKLYWDLVANSSAYLTELGVI